MRPARLPALLALLLAAVLFAAPPVAADDTPDPDDNVAVAVNTEDGASVFRLAFSVRMAANGVVDEDNHAWALASCTDCQTVALAFQVVLVWNDPNVAVPHNQAVAYNDQCVACLTYASATQIVLGFDGPVRFTDEGRRRLIELQRTLADLENRIGEMSLAELHAAVGAAKQELISILAEELVEAPVPAEATADATTTAVPAEPSSQSTQTTSATPSTATTAPAAGESTTTTSPPANPSSTSTPSTASTTTTTTTTPTEPASTSTTSASTTTTPAVDTTATTAGG